MTPRPRRTFTPQARTRFRVLTAGVTGLVTFGAITATGAVAGESARSFDEDQARQQAEKAAALEQARRDALPKVVYVDRKRPHKTVIRTKVVYRTGGLSVSPGTGGSVRTTTSSSGSGPSQSGQSASAPAPAPAAPAAPAPPAPSSGS